MTFLPSVSFPKQSRSRLFLFLCVGVVLFFLCGIGLYAWVHHVNTPPADFPLEKDIIVHEGLTLQQTTKLLAEQHVVRSSFLLYITLLYTSDSALVQAGSYKFPETLTTYQVARALFSGMYQSPLVRITFPEGFTTRDFRLYYPASYTPKKEDVSFQEYEGYLFPDTYHITSTMPEQQLVALMRKTFDEKLSPYTDEIKQSGFTLPEVITLASIIEREAKDEASKKRVSGILQKRLSGGMLLQVDATLDYLLNKTSAELTSEDLNIDSPFNTYTHKGLPPSPISNPGIESIEAVLHPEKTDYLYYLTAPDGTFYYAKTFAEHKKNKQKYLP